MKPKVHIVGLGPGDASLTTAQTIEQIESGRDCFLRTGRHPSAHLARAALAFDEVYEQHDTFEEVYADIAGRLLAAATDAGEITYVVPGSPLVLEKTVAALVANPEVETVVYPALSFLDTAWSALVIDPVTDGVTLIDAHRLDEYPAATGPRLVAHCHNQRVLSDLKLSVDEPSDQPVVIMQALGTKEERLVEVDWWDLDRTIEADHLTSVFVPEPAANVGQSLGRLADLIVRLRRDCPWDQEQTHRSLRRHLLEETYEVLEVLDQFDDDDSGPDADLLEELGDLLFQPLLHAAIAAEQGRFDVAEMADRIHDKLVARHPHVFSGEDVTTDELVETWDQNKLAEKSRSSVFDGIAPAMPALARLAKVLRKADAAALLVETDGLTNTERRVIEQAQKAVAADIDPEDSVRALTARVEKALRREESGAI